MRTSATIRSGTVVYHVADPRRHGIVHSLNLRDGRFVANVRWIDTGRKGHWMPVADLRRVTADTPSQPVRGRRLSKLECGSYDGHAVRWTHDEAWALVNGTWRRTEPVFVLIKAKRLTKQAYLDAFDPVPPLPSDAFSSDPSHWPIRYGRYDGFAYRFRDCEVWGCFNGQWREERPSELVYNVGVETEQDYHRSFGDLPPLPDTAFCSGWASPLV